MAAPGAPRLLGIDVSSWQGRPDWAAVAASGVAFAWTKATEGTNYVSPTFGYNWAGIKAAGLVRGAYHFAQPSFNTPEAEVDWFLTAVRDLQPGDLLALDLEAGSGTLLAWALRFLGYLTERVGFRPMLYSGEWFLGPHGVQANDELAQYGLWLSGYTPVQPPLPPGWTTLAEWQFTSSAQVPGIGGGVDQEWFYGTRDQLLKYGKPAPVASMADQLVTLLSVIGDATYPDGSNMDDLAAGQTVSKRVFVRELVQQAKGLLGA